MKRATISILQIAALGAVLSFGTAGCSDQSAPNRRGQERAPLTGRRDTDNAEKRALEPQKRDLPTGGGSEFPGQSMAPAPATDAPTVVYLDFEPIIPYSAPATTTAPATTQPAPEALNPLFEPAIHTSVDRAQKPVFVDDNKKPYDLPGQPMSVPGSGQTIAPEWGHPTVLTNYPHRPWPDSSTTYESGQVWHNRIYYHFLFANSDNPAEWSTNQGKTDLEGLVEMPYFVGQTLALPVLMVINPPLAQRGTRQPSVNPVYQGKVSPGGPVIPAPEPGQIHYVYPPTATMDQATTQPTTQP